MEKVLNILHEHRDRTGAKLGMWLFIFSEILFFGGLFLIYAVFRFKYTEGFHNASKELNVIIGTLNTIILLTSSLTVALSIKAIEIGKRKDSLLFLFSTIFLGFFFLINKYFEWSYKISHGIYPGSKSLLTLSSGEIAFYNLYYIMTGLHALHVFIGIIIFAFMFYLYSKEPRKKINLWGKSLKLLKGKEILGNKISGDVEEIKIEIRYFPDEDKVSMIDNTKLFNAGLYWHLVDIIWIFLFPLFYLIS